MSFSSVACTLGHRGPCHLLVSWRRSVAVPRAAVAAEPGAAAGAVPWAAAAAVPAVLTAAAAVRLVAVDSPHLRRKPEQSIMQRFKLIKL
jgi:hypothetical protein